MREPPYGIICNRLKEGRVIPFLGAGASFVGRKPDEEWKPQRPRFLPSGKELANFLADEAEFPSNDPHELDDLAKVASYYEDISDRCELRDRLHKLFNHNFKFGPIHKFLASIPCPQVIVVTNYDTLMEQAFKEAGKPYDLVIYPAEGKEKDNANAILWWSHGESKPKSIVPNELDIDFTKTNVIYKMHGSIVHENTAELDNYVITEEDYVEFLSRMTSQSAVPPLFYQHFRDRNFLFIGYGLRDWNLRVVLKNLSKYLSTKHSNKGTQEIRSWAIQHKPSELEKTLWSNRNVEIFDIIVNKFVEKIQKRMGAC